MFPVSRSPVRQERRIRMMGIERRVFDVFGIEIWVGFLQAKIKTRGPFRKLRVFEFWSDTYRWRWPVEKDGSVANCFVTLDNEPDAESEEEGDCDDGVDGRLWV